MASINVGTILSRFQIKDLDTQLEMLQQVEKQIDKLEGRTIQIGGGGMGATSSLGRMTSQFKDMGSAMQQIEARSQAFQKTQDQISSQLAARAKITDNLTKQSVKYLDTQQLIAEREQKIQEETDKTAKSTQTRNQRLLTAAENRLEFTKQNIESLKSERDQIDSNLNALRTQAEELQRIPLGLRVQAMFEQARAGVDRLAGGLTQIKSGLSQITSGIAEPFKAVYGFAQNAQRAVFRLGDSLVHIGQIGAATAFRLELLLAPIQASAVSTIKNAIDLEHALALVTTQTDLTGQAARDFEGEAGAAIRDVTNQWAVGSTDMADALYNLVSTLDISNEAALALLPTIAKFAVAGDASADEVSKMATVLLATYVPNLDDAAEVTQKLEQFLTQTFVSMKKGTGTFEDYVQQLGDFVRVSQEAGADLPDVLALFAGLSRTRGPAEAATQIKRLAQTLLTPRFREAATGLGVEVDQYVEGQKDVGKYVPRATMMTKAQREEMAQLAITIQDLNDKIAATRLRLDDAKEGSATAIDQARILRGRDRELAEAQARYNELLAMSTDETKMFINTGAKEARPAFDVLKDIFDILREMPRPQMLEKMAELFPNIRAELPALEFEHLADELLSEDGFVNALRKITEITPEVASDIDLVNNSGNNLLVRLGNNIKNFGVIVYEDLQQRFKGAIELLIEGFRNLQDMSPQLRQKLANLFIALSGLPFVLLAVATAIMGAGGLVAALGTLLSPNLLIIGLGLFMGFREEIEKLRDILGRYNLTSLEGIASFIGDLAVSLGMIDAGSVERIFDKLGIVADVDPANVMALQGAIGGITDKIQSGITFVKDWVDAIGRFLEMVGEREGIVGGFLAQLERIFGVLGLKAGEVDLKLDTTEARANLIDKILGAILAVKIAQVALNVAGGIVNVVGGVVNVAGGVGGIGRSLFGPPIPGRGATGGGTTPTQPGLPGMGPAAAAARPGGLLNLPRNLLLRFFPGLAALIPTAGAVGALGGAALAARGSQGLPTSATEQLTAFLQAARDQGINLQEVPGLQELLVEFGKSGQTLEHQNEILEEIKDLLTPEPVFKEDMFQGAPVSTKKVFDESQFGDAPVTLQRNIQNVFDRLTSNVPELGLPTPYSSPFLPRDFPTFGMPRTFIPELGLPTLGPMALPEAGRGGIAGTAAINQRFLDVFDRLITEGVDIKTGSVQELIQQFAAAQDDPTRQAEIVSELETFLEEDRTTRFDFLTRLERTLNLFASQIASSWPRMVPGTAPGRRAVAFHSGGYLNLLANEFVSSPLTTRLLESVTGGRLTQSSMRQLAFAQAGMAPQQINHVVTMGPGGGLTIDLQAHGMGNFSLTAEQQEKLSWEITSFVAEKLRRSFGD